MEIITLTSDEYMSAWNAAATQMCRVLTTSRSNKGHECDRRPVRIQSADKIQGCLAEWAAGKYFGVFPGFGIGGIIGGDFKEAEIRGTEHWNGYLCLYTKDFEEFPDKPFLLVAGVWPKFKMAGWITPSDPVVLKYKTKTKEGHIQYHVKQDVLRDPRELKAKELYERRRAEAHSE